MTAAAFSPADPDFENRVRASFAQQGMLTSLGAQMELLRAGAFHLTAPCDTRFSQQDGFLHTGVVTALRKPP